MLGLCRAALCAGGGAGDHRSPLRKPRSSRDAPRKAFSPSDAAPGIRGTGEHRSPLRRGFAGAVFCRPKPGFRRGDLWSPEITPSYALAEKNPPGANLSRDYFLNYCNNSLIKNTIVAKHSLSEFRKLARFVGACAGSLGWCGDRKTRKPAASLPVSVWPRQRQARRPAWRR